MTVTLSATQAYFLALFVAYLWLLAGLGFIGMFEQRHKRELTLLGRVATIVFIPVFGLIGAVQYLHKGE